MLISLFSVLDALPAKIDKIRKRSRLKLLFRRRVRSQLEEVKRDLVNAKQNFKASESFRESKVPYGLTMSCRQRRTTP
jgi:primosomal protein N'